MAHITVLGGTGYAGGAIVAEAVRRGHQVTSVSRNAPAEEIEGVDHVIGSVLDPAVLDRVVPGSDVVVSALSPRGDMAGELEGALRELARRVDGTSTRVGHVGGASSLHVEPGGPTLWDVTVDTLPDEVKPEILTGMRILDDLRETPESVDWFFVSPPEVFGAWAPVPANGRYRLGGDVLLRDEEGESTISAADLAVAIVDEIERPAHHRGRFTAIREA